MENAIVGRKIAVGIGLETTRGTAKSPDYFYPHLDFSFKDNIETKNNESAYNTIVKHNSIDVMNISGEGSISGKMFVKGLYYWLALVFGQKATTAGVTGDTNAKQHTFTLSESNTHLSGTLAIKNAIEAKKYSYAMLESFKINWSADDYPKIEMSFKSKKGVRVESNEIVAGYIDEPEFLPKHFDLKIAENAAGLASAQAVKATSFSLEFKKNLKTDFGKGDVVDIYNMDFEISGSFEKTIRDTKFQDMAATGESFAFEFAMIDDKNKVGTKTPTSLKITAGKAGITGWNPSYGLSDIATESISFEVLFDVKTKKTIEAELVNGFTY